MSSIENLGGTHACYSFPYPPEIAAKTGSCSLLMPRKSIFEMMAREQDKNDPEQAAFFREIASHFPDADHSGYSVDRDGNRNILIDYDDWDGLTDAEKLTRGNRNAAIAVLDRLRFDLEMMNDDPANNAEINEIRQAIAAAIEDR